MADDITPTKDGVLNAARRLSLIDRIDLYTALGEELGDDIPDKSEESDVSDEFSAEQLAELDRRIAEYQKNPGDTIPWEDIERECIKKYGAGG